MEENTWKINGFLMSGDRKVAEIRNNEVAQISAPIPLFLQNYPLLTWLKSRAICGYRSNTQILKETLGIPDASYIAAAMRVHGATITDNYWICQEGESLTYADVRFTKDTFADVALTGICSRTFTEEELRENCPELTNIGSYDKCWKLLNGTWWMFKEGSPWERFSEIFIAELGAKLGFSMAEYQPAGPYVKTPDFTHGRLNLELAEGLVGGNDYYPYNYDTFTRLDPKLGKEYLDMVFMDALCYNTDRHTQNYGVLRDQDTGKILCMAPNFDNNNALISHGYFRKPPSEWDRTIPPFVNFLKKRDLSYKLPDLDGEMLSSLAASVLPEEDIDRDSVVQMLLMRMQCLRDRLGQ